MIRFHEFMLIEKQSTLTISYDILVLKLISYTTEP